MRIFNLNSWTCNTDYDSETDDDNEELENSPPAKRQKLDVKEESSGSSASSSSKITNGKDERCLPFLLTRVRGIPSEFNARNLAIGIKGTLKVCEILSCDEQWRYCVFPYGPKGILKHRNVISKCYSREHI